MISSLSAAIVDCLAELTLVVLPSVSLISCYFSLHQSLQFTFAHSACCVWTVRVIRASLNPHQAQYLVASLVFDPFYLPITSGIFRRSYILLSLASGTRKVTPELSVSVSLRWSYPSLCHGLASWLATTEVVFKFSLSAYFCQTPLSLRLPVTGHFSVSSQRSQGYILTQDLDLHLQIVEKVDFRTRCFLASSDIPFDRASVADFAKLFIGRKLVFWTEIYPLQVWEFPQDLASIYKSWEKSVFEYGVFGLRAIYRSIGFSKLILFAPARSQKFVLCAEIYPPQVFTSCFVSSCFSASSLLFYLLFCADVGYVVSTAN